MYTVLVFSSLVKDCKTVFRKPDDSLFKTRMTNTSNYAKNDCCLSSLCFGFVARPAFISFDHPKYLQYHQGLAEIRRYLNELFPADACITEEQIQEQLFYKEFLLYLHRGEYKRAKQFVAEASQIIRSTRQYNQARKSVRSWLRFTAFRLYKELNYKKDIKQRT